MTTPAVELVWLHNLAEQRVAALDNPLGLELDEQLQASQTLRFQVRASDPRAGYLGEDLLIWWNGRYFRTTEIELVRDATEAMWHVAAEARWIDLIGYPAPGAIVTGAIGTGLISILTGSGWTVGSVEADGGGFTLEPADSDTCLGVLRTWANMTNRELEFDTTAKTVSLVVQQGDDLGLGFRYGRNLTSVQRKAEPPSCTRLYPVGKDDLTPAAVNPTGLAYVDNFTWYTAQGLTLLEAQTKYLKVQRWTDDRYLLPLNLLDAGTRRLALLAVPRITYQASAVDLSALTGTAETFDIGDTCRVWDGPTDTQVDVRIVRKVTRPLEPWNTKVELGFLQQTVPTSGASSSSSAGAFNMLVNNNVDVLNVAGGQVTLNAIPVALSASIGNLIFGSTIEATATGTGTVTVSFWYGPTRIGPLVLQAFVAGPLHIGVPDFLVGITTSASLYAKAQITSGSGSLLIGNDAAHLYVAGAGLAAGVNSNNIIDIAEAVTYLSSVSDTGGVSTQLYTDLDPTPSETVDTTPTAVASETVTSVTTP